jgi:NitT/TauT family transport system substrate-binding protein
MTKIKAVAGALAVALIGIAGAAQAEPIKIRIQHDVPPAHITPLIPMAPKELYKYWGKSYVVEPTRLQGSGPGMTALAAGEIELANLGAQTLALLVGRAQIDGRVIAQHTSSGVPGYRATAFWVRPGEFNTLDDLKGKVLGVNARGSTPDSVYKILLGRKGWKEGTDYQIAEVRFAAQLPALETKRIDVAFLVEPFGRMAEKKGFKMAFSTSDALGPTETLAYTGRADWIAKNRAAVVDFLEDHMRFRRWLLSDDPATRAQVIKVLSELTKQPPEAFADWVFTKEDPSYRAPDLKVDVARMQKNIDDIYAIGGLPVTIDAKKYVDMSLAEEAWKRFQASK